MYCLGWCHVHTHNCTCCQDGFRLFTLQASMHKCGFGGLSRLCVWFECMGCSSRGLLHQRQGSTLPHKYSRKYTCAHLHTKAHTQTHIHTNTHAHTYTHTNTHIQTHTQPHAVQHAQMALLAPKPPLVSPLTCSSATAWWSCAAYAQSICTRQELDSARNAAVPGAAAGSCCCC
jgi:hypothetical protein